MNTNFELAIVIPCYNEGNRLRIKEYVRFLDNHTNILLCFVNDGSIDSTIEVIQELKTIHSESIHIVNLTENIGKAETVRKGMLECLKLFDFKKIACLNANLSITLEECALISKKFEKTTIFAFSSRIPKLGNNIRVNNFSFFIDRCIATLISKQLGLKVNDTRCECKVFMRNTALVIFKGRFDFRRLLSIEIFYRLIALYGEGELKYVIKEIPVRTWKYNKIESMKIHSLYCLLIDLYKLKKRYKINLLL